MPRVLSKLKSSVLQSNMGSRVQCFMFFWTAKQKNGVLSIPLEKVQQKNVSCDRDRRAHFKKNKKKQEKFRGEYLNFLSDTKACILLYFRYWTLKCLDFEASFNELYHARFQQD